MRYEDNVSDEIERQAACRTLLFNGSDAMGRTAGLLFITCAFLGGCVTEQEATQRIHYDAMACAAGKKTQLSKVRCGIDAENRYLMPRYPDLVYLVHYQAERLALRVDRGELTRSQAMARLRRVEARVAKEQKRRETSIVWHTPRLPRG